jgi:hypothetical protein
MKRNLVFFFCMLFSVLTVSGGSAQDAGSAGSGSTADTAAKPAAPVEQKKAELTDEYLNITYTVEKSIDLKSGDVKVMLRTNPGTFNIYGIKESGIEVPLLAAYDKSSSSFFSVLINKTAYRLNREAGVSAELRRTAGSAQIAYTIEGAVRVLVDFSCFASVPGVPDDMVRVRVYTTNLGKKPQQFAVKMILDTILGENAGTHFITASRKSVDSETAFTAMNEDRWIISSNGRSSLQVLLDGPGISKPKFVYLANRDIVSQEAWEPDPVENRSFNSVLAYNNSAIEVNWPQQQLDPRQTGTSVFYFAVGSDSAVPGGAAFLDRLPGKAVPPAPENQAPVVKNTVPAPVPAAAAPAVQPAIDFVVPPVTDDQLDPVYIQNLIDRINSLQSDPNLVDRSEIRRLNAELDAILAKIRQQHK